MLKNIRIFGIVLLVAILAIVVAVWACDDLKVARDAAKIARDAARAEWKKASQAYSVVILTQWQKNQEDTIRANPPNNEPWSNSGPTPQAPPNFNTETPSYLTPKLIAGLQAKANAEKAKSVPDEFAQSSSRDNRSLASL